MKKYNTKKGFTLIEIIISIAILGIVLIAFLSVFSMGTVTIFRAGNRSHANKEAQSIVDRIYEESNSELTLTELEAKIVSILEVMVGTNNYISYTTNISDFDEPYANQDRLVRFYLQNKTLLSGIDVPTFYLRLYYQRGSQHVTIVAPLSK